MILEKVINLYEFPIQFFTSKIHIDAIENSKEPKNLKIEKLQINKLVSCLKKFTSFVRELCHKFRAEWKEFVSIRRKNNVNNFGTEEYENELTFTISSFLTSTPRLNTRKGN